MSHLYLDLKFGHGFSGNMYFLNFYQFLLFSFIFELMAGPYRNSTVFQFVCETNHKGSITAWAVTDIAFLELKVKSFLVNG